MRHNWHVAWRQLLYIYIDIFTIVFVAVQRLNEEKTMTTTTTKAMKPPHSYEACGFVSSYLIDITYGTCMAVVVIHSAYFIVFITFCIQKLSIETEAFSAFYTHTHKCKTKYKSNVFVKAK